VPTVNEWPSESDPLTRLLVILTTVALATSTARADYADDAIAGLKIAKAMADRARRSIAFGPQVGYLGAVDTRGNGMQGISFGLSLYSLKVSSVLDIQDIVKDALRARVEDEIKRVTAAGGVPPNPKALAKRFLAEIQDDLIGPVHPKTLEKPRFAIITEGVWLLAPGGFQLRAGASYGIGPVSLGLMGGMQRANDDTAPLVGPELSVHLTPIGKSRTPVIDLYTRADFTFEDMRTSTYFVFGLRALADVL
jgi:hypothetical protein